ncbi:MAG TPA: hypothetical protein DCY13_23810, partial [Verrucomicrobiales bacterium]|nr:hypothetical protein [Verrucomicrobiales bacterium]
FERRGIAHTQRFIDEDFARRLADSGFNLLLAVTPSSHGSGTFEFIASFHDGDDSSQFVLGQWRHHLILMQGDDYRHARKLPRLTVDVTDRLDQPMLITIAAGPAGTALWVNDATVDASPKLSAQLPSSGDGARLVLGNSVHARHGWRGVLHRLIMVPGALPHSEVERLARGWLDDTSLELQSGSMPLLDLRFDGPTGSVVQDQSGRGNDLVVPPRATALERSLFAWKLVPGEINRSLAVDIIVNLTGFIPFGWLLLADPGMRRLLRGRLIMAVLAGFLFSLGLETVQAWIPTRSSSLLDLFLNTAGTAVGALLFLKSCRPRANRF